MYLFRLDATSVVDATKVVRSLGTSNQDLCVRTFSHRRALSSETDAQSVPQGGPARYINHSCEPNCYTKVWRLSWSSALGACILGICTTTNSLDVNTAGHYRFRGKRPHWHLRQEEHPEGGGALLRLLGRWTTMQSMVVPDVRY